jgi:hypothetical protein
MATITKNKLSASTNGRGILITQTATAGTTIHTAVGNATDWDEIWLWAHNTSTSAVKLTIEYGGTGTGDLIEMTIPPESGLIPIVSGLLVQDSVVVRGFAGTGSVINIFGFVNSIDY